MPYLSERGREVTRQRGFAESAGELNFRVTEEVNAFILHGGLRYERLNAAIGALECAKLELYRRLAAEYEDAKIEANGDVYFPPLVAAAQRGRA